jgi:hypothetical protein
MFGAMKAKLKKFASDVLVFYVSIDATKTED